MGTRGSPPHDVHVLTTLLVLLTQFKNKQSHPNYSVRLSESDAHADQKEVSATQDYRKMPTTTAYHVCPPLTAVTVVFDYALVVMQKQNPTSSLANAKMSSSMDRLKLRKCRTCNKLHIPPNRLRSVSGLVPWKPRTSQWDPIKGTFEAGAWVSFL